jgi:hypothetical protein
MRGLFRRNKHRLDGNNKQLPAQTAGSLRPDSPHEEILPPHSPPSLSDSASEPGGVWYKRPMTTANGERDALSHFGHLYHHQRVVVPSSSQSTFTGAPIRKTDPQRSSNKETGLFHRQKKKNGYSESKFSTNILIASLIKQDWPKAFSQIESQPDIVWQQDAIFLHGHKTVALPLHVAACCVDVPLALFDQILYGFPAGAQKPDEVMGRLPLHWACMSNASNHVLEKLIQIFPDACKSYDLTDSRSPLHYLTIFASTMDQFQPLLVAPVNHKWIMQHADKEGMTPLDLARSTNNPIKAEIVVTLVHHEQIALSNSQKRKQFHGQEKRTSVPEYMQGPNKTPAPTGSSGKILPVNPPGELYSASRQSYGIAPTPGAQADAFRDEENEQRYPAMLPPKEKVRRNPLPNRHEFQCLDHNGVNETCKAHALAAADDCQPRAQRHRKDPTRSVFNDENRLLDPPTYQQRPKATKASSDSWSNRDSKYAAKTDSSSAGHGGVINSKDEKAAANQKQDFRSSNERNQMSAQSMMDEMFQNMHQLEIAITKLQADLNDKDTDMSNLKVVAKEMAIREQNLLLGLENSRNVVRHQHEKLNQKREAVELLKDKIATLQAELMKEESILLPMEKTILLLEQEVLEKEQTLQDHHQEQASFEAMRQAILQEKDGLTRDLENSNSELQSLKAIQHLAKGEKDDM